MFLLLICLCQFDFQTQSGTLRASRTSFSSPIVVSSLQEANVDISNCLRLAPGTFFNTPGAIIVPNKILGGSVVSIWYNGRGAIRNGQMGREGPLVCTGDRTPRRVVWGHLIPGQADLPSPVSLKASLY